MCCGKKKPPDNFPTFDSIIAILFMTMLFDSHSVIVNETFQITMVSIVLLTA